MKKPKLSEIKYLGTMYARDAWGNDDAEKAILWLQARLKEEMDRNEVIEMENFGVSVKPRGLFSRLEE